MTATMLPVPDEPLALKGMARTLLEQAPAEGLPLVLAGRWLADPLWQQWGEGLRQRGMDRGGFDQVVATYGNELRLWVVGERPWAQAASGLAGRVARRLPSGASAQANVGERDWREALRRVGLTPESEMPALVFRLGELRLLFDLREAETSGAIAGPLATPAAIVWAGGRPRDPEAPFGESRPGTTGAAALAEALGRFLVKDPAYPPRGDIRSPLRAGRR